MDIGSFHAAQADLFEHTANALLSLRNWNLEEARSERQLARESLGRLQAVYSDWQIPAWLAQHLFVINGGQRDVNAGPG